MSLCGEFKTIEICGCYSQHWEEYLIQTNNTASKMCKSREGMSIRKTHIHSRIQIRTLERMFLSNRISFMFILDAILFESNEDVGEFLMRVPHGFKRCVSILTWNFAEIIVSCYITKDVDIITFLKFRFIFTVQRVVIIEWFLF